MAFTAIKWIFVLLVILALEGVVTSTQESTNSSTKKSSTSTKHDTISTPVATKSTKPAKTTPSPTTSNTNKTEEGSNLDGKMSSPYNNKGLLKRMLYVAIAFSVIVALYFIVKTIRTKTRKSKSKKYGMIYSSGDVEMQPLEEDQDDEDDMTVFDRKTRK